VEDKNIVHLREHMEALFNERTEGHKHEHQLLEQAVARARETIDLRLESMNEFRSQIQSERETMLSKDKFDVYHEQLSLRVANLEKGLSSMQGKMIATAGAVTVGLVILGLVLRFVVP